MNDFWLYLKLGVTHVLDLNAYDHVLFITVLVAAYSLKQWRKLIALVSLFTLGHTISLLLANYDLVTVSSSWIEFLIPITILIAAFNNIVISKRFKPNQKMMLFYFITLFFGLIHGFGFARYYKMIQTDHSISPLFEFALGVEISQIIVVLVVLILSFIIQNIFKFSKKEWLIIISSVVIGLAIPLLRQTWPF